MSAESRQRVASAVVDRVVLRYGDRLAVECRQFDAYPTILEVKFVPKLDDAAWVSLFFEDFEHVFSVAGFQREHIGSFSETETISWLFAQVCEVADHGLALIHGAARMFAGCSADELLQAERVWKPW